MTATRSSPEREYDARLEGLTLKQWLTLAVIDTLPQPVPSTSVVARALGTSYQNTAKLLRALEAKGVIATAPSPADQRARTITATPAARFTAVDEEWGERMVDEVFAGVNAGCSTASSSTTGRSSPPGRRTTPSPRPTIPRPGNNGRSGVTGTRRGEGASISD